MERLPRGLRRRSRKAVLPKGDVGSNPTLSAMHHVGCMACPELNVVQGARVHCVKKRRDAREAEGARLEIVYPANNGIVGSTPTLSAMHHVGCMAALNST